MIPFKQHIKALVLIAIMGAIYLVWPAQPKLEQQPEETTQHFEYRYLLAKANAYLYDGKFIGQRWRGTHILDDIATKASAPYNISALTALFEYYRFHGLPRTVWLNRSWHEPLPRDYVEKAGEAALRLAEHAPDKAVELLAEFIIYPVTVPAIPEDAIQLVREAAQQDNTQAIKAMRVYCTDERFWNPCPADETALWTKKEAEDTLEAVEDQAPTVPTTEPIAEGAAEQTTEQTTEEIGTPTSESE